ncbi:MAG: methyl-viologen-reducing hydrogenase subunit delta, partial [Methanosphaera sp. rholeuAM130]
YDAGNYKWRRRAQMIRYILDEMGIDQRRFKHEWVSASEGSKFQRLMNEFHEELSEIKE